MVRNLLIGALFGVLILTGTVSTIYGRRAAWSQSGSRVDKATWWYSTLFFWPAYMITVSLPAVPAQFGLVIAVPLLAGWTHHLIRIRKPNQTEQPPS